MRISDGSSDVCSSDLWLSCCCQWRSCRRSYYVVPERSIRKNFLIRAGNESDACEKVPGTIGGMPYRTCGAVAEWSKALAWKVSIRQKRIEGSNPYRPAKHPFPRVPNHPLAFPKPAQ